MTPFPVSRGEHNHVPLAPREHCRELCQQSGSNFIYAFAFLSRKRRRALEAFYAFCLSVDSAADDTNDKDKARELLEQWRREVARMYRGKPELPVAIALAPHLKTYGVPEHYLTDIISGCEMDVVTTAYASFTELEQYCYRVASCVGLVCLYLFGIEPTEHNTAAAVALGKALQLTNIIRDIPHDLSLGRIYLPAEDLQQAGLSTADLCRPTNEAALSRLLTREIARAREFFAAAFGRFPSERRARRQWIVPLLIGRIYERLLDRIEQESLAVFRERLRVRFPERLAIVGRTLRELYLR